MVLGVASVVPIQDAFAATPARTVDTVSDPSDTFNIVSLTVSALTTSGADDIFEEMNLDENDLLFPNAVLSDDDHEFLKKKLLHSSWANSNTIDSLYNNNDNNENPLSESEKKTVHEFLLALHGDIDVLNEQSYPTVGGYWTVEFVTKGTHDLIVSAINATSFGAGLPDDVEFISLYDSDGSEIAPEFIYDDSGSNASVVFPDYSNDDVGSFKMLVHTPGKHHLKFEFGNDVAYANNNAYPNSTIEINDSTFNGPELSNSDQFGSSIVNIGDLNGDGTSDIAVGAPGDDDGGGSSGAIHILFMNDDGSVSQTIEINSSTQNGPELSNGDSFGASITNIGDLNGDGVLDIAVGAPGDDDGGTNRGAVHILFMNDDGSVTNTIEINDSTQNGPELSNGDSFGVSITNIGDLNGDGVLDIAVGATFDDDGGTNSGAIHILFMNDDGSVTNTIEINDSTQNGPELETADLFGSSIANIGDLNGDGVLDIAVGAQSDDDGGTNRGAVHILFMNDDGSVTNTIEINDSTQNGPELSNGDFFGSSIANIGDLNNDGTPDIAVDAHGNDDGGTNRGAIHILFMNDDGSVSQTIEINDSTEPGPRLSDNVLFGFSIANIGDLNGDGVLDIAVGAPDDSTGGTNRGAVHIIYLSTAVSHSGTIEQTIEINDSTPNGPDLSQNDIFGVSIVNIGDLNGDGTSDIAVGAQSDDDGGTNRGAIHILFMNDDGSVTNTIEINDSTPNGPSLDDGDNFGSSITNIGDLNGDGVLDIAVGAPNDDNGDTSTNPDFGAIHIMLMNDDGSVSQTIEINDSTQNGPELETADLFGSSIVNIGDLNGDGVLDIAVGATGDDDGGGSSGAIHIMLMNDDGSVSQTIEINDSTPNGPELETADLFGSSIVNIGDLNGDGVLDIAVGATGDDGGGTDRGAIHIMLMNDDGSVTNTIEINDSTPNGPSLDDGDNFGISIAGIVNLDSDRVSHIAVGAKFGDDAGRGNIHILFMNDDGSVSQTREINNSNTPSLDITGPTLFGRSIAPIGDHNGDGTPDIAVGESNHFSPHNGGVIHIIYLDKSVVVNTVSSTTADGEYDTGALVDITIVFSEPVTVTGTPQITLETGDNDRTADYTSGSGTDTLTFQYAVQSGDVSPDLNYVDVNSLMLNGGTITSVDSQSNRAVLTLPPPDLVLKVTPENAFGSLGNFKDLAIISGAPPTFESATLQEDIGLLSVTFSKELDSDSDTVALDGFTITDDLPEGIEVRLSVFLDGATHAIDPGSPNTIAITLTEMQRQQVVAYTSTNTGSNLHLDIAAGAIQDTLENDIAASEDNPITSISDAVAPTFVSGMIQEGTGVLSVTFSEAIDPSNIMVDSFTITDTITSNALPPVSLAGLAPAIDSGSPDTIKITLTEAQRQQVIGYTGTNDELHLDIAAGAVRDIAQNNIASSVDNEITMVDDTIQPTFVSGMIQEGTGVLSVTFSETIDPSNIMVDSFTITDTISSNALPPVSLAGLAPAIDSGSPDTIKITLTEAQRQQVIGYTGTNDELHLDIAAGAVRDTAQNDIEASEDNPITSISDAVAPTFVSGMIQEGTGVLSVTFSEAIDPSNIMVDSFTITDTISSNALPPVSLAGLAPAIDSGSPDTIKITLTEAQRQQVIGYTGTNDELHLDIAAGAVRDIAQNNIASSVDNEITMVDDTIQPTFVSGMIQEGTGVLSVTFSEAIDPSNIMVDSFTITDTISSNALPPVSLAGLAPAIDSGSPDTIKITLTEAQRQQVIGYTGTNDELHLDIAAGAVRDTAQNDIASSVDNEITMVDDTILPTFDSGVIDVGTGILSVTFSETIDPSHITVGGFTISDIIDNSLSVSLAGATPAVDPGSPDTITITLTGQQYEEIISYIRNSNNDELHLDIAAGAVRDTAQNDIEASEDNPITRTGTLPRIPSGGGSSGDNTPPSVYVGFDSDEFPLKYDGVNYQSHQFETIHTAMIETGEEFETTLTLYDNSGPRNIQHVEMYVNQFGPQILNDLTETIVIYDEQSGLEIIDPYDLITTANVIPSISGNKAVYEIMIVFEDEIPQSDIILRVWDTQRNQAKFHLHDTLIVELSNRPSGIISSESTSGSSESTSGSSESASQSSGSTTSESASESASESTSESASESASQTTTSSTESVIVTDNWTDTQLSVLKKWGGFDTETASDADVLSEFGVKGVKIPAYVSDVTKWILNDEITPKEFVNLLQYLKSMGMLSDVDQTGSFPVNTQDDLEEFVADSSLMDERLKFEFDESTLNSKADLGDLEDKLRILRALGNNEIIQSELENSNAEFDALDDADYVIDQRNSAWLRNPSTVTPFMESLMTNDSALIAKAIIENDVDSIVPITSIVITNAYGVNIVITEKTHDYKQSDEQWWGETKSDGAYIMSGSGSEEYGGLYTSEASTVITDSQGDFIGIIKATVNFEKALLSN